MYNGMKNKLIYTTLFILSLTPALYSQGSGIPSQLRVKTDANGYLVATAIGQTAPINTSTFNNTRLKTDSNGYLLVVISGGSITAPLTLSANGIGTTSTDGLILSNSTAATAGVPVQISPRLRFRANVWDTTITPTSVTDDWWAEVVPCSVCAVTSSFSELRFNQKITQTGYNAYVPLTITAGGPAMFLGAFSTFGASFAGFWAEGTRTSTNYNFLVTAGQVIFNAANSGTADIEFRIGATTRLSVSNAGININGPANTAPTIPLTIINQAKTLTVFTVSDTGVTNTVVGYQVNGAAASNTVLTGNGTNFVGNASPTLTSVTAKLISVGAVTGVANVGANSCGTTTATISGTDNNGEITVGATSGTQCRIAFTTAAANKRECTASDETTGNLMRTNYVDTTHTDIIGTMVAADKLVYICFAR